MIESNYEPKVALAAVAKKHNLDGAVECIAYTKASNFPVWRDLRTWSLEDRRGLKQQIHHPQVPDMGLSTCGGRGKEGETPPENSRYANGKKANDGSHYSCPESCQAASSPLSESGRKEIDLPLRSLSRGGTFRPARSERRHGSYSWQMCSYIPKN
jgi:hypothetical protein